MTDQTFQAAKAIKDDITKIQAYLALIPEEAPNPVSDQDIQGIINLKQRLEGFSSDSINNAISSVNREFFLGFREALIQQLAAANNSFEALADNPPSS